jgi:hypothetical protein
MQSFAIVSKSSAVDLKALASPSRLALAAFW